MIYFAIISFLLSLFYSLFLYKIIKGLYVVNTKPKSRGEFKQVSIIIPFRNESENILNCYHSLEQQTYPHDKYEIIFVDDNSTDDSFEKLKKSAIGSNIRILKLKNSKINNAYKKQAVKLGIEESNGEIIVTTDADCLHGNNWLETLISYYENDVAFISGPVEFSTNDTLFGNLQKLEFAGLILTGAGLIGFDSPIICNAANLSFRKNVFHEVGGYDDTMNLTSGDDELLMQKISALGKYKIKFAFGKNAIVVTEANKNINKFYQQRKRWASKSLFYNSKLLIVKLSAIFLFYLNLLAMPLLSIFVNKYIGILFLFEFLCKIILEFRIMYYGKNNLFNKLNLKLFFIAEIIHVPYIVISAVAGLFGNYSWKNREVAR